MSSPASDVVVHPAWLPASAFALFDGRLVAVPEGSDADPVVETLRREVSRAGAKIVAPGEASVVFTIDGERSQREGFTISRDGSRIVVTAANGRGLLDGFFHLVSHREAAFTPGTGIEGTFTPAVPIRMLDHWDNIDVHPVMGQVERGYAGGSLFYDDGDLRWDLSRLDDYARLLASSGVNHVSINNVNVHRTETTLLTERLGWVGRIADKFRPWGITTHLAVNFSAPLVLGDLDTSDPLDPAVQDWWKSTAERVYAAIPDFGGFVVKADSEGQPGPFAYNRTHADGANLLARAVAPFGGIVHWRCFVYNHKQDWRDRSTDRARAAFDHFTPLDGQFDDNVIIQVKYGPLDFQVREPVSPLIAAMPNTRVAIELQVTEEYSGQQKHVYNLAEQWREIFDFDPWGSGGARLWQIAAGQAEGGRTGSIVAVANTGDDPFWTGHPLAQFNLYAFGRMAWDPTASPAALLDEWIALTFGADPTAVGETVRALLAGSRDLYESYTAPLGVCFMVNPGHHYGPSIDGYEYSPWGTYHFADRDGIGVDRTRATGTGYSGQYHEPWATRFETLADCPDDLLLFFHHVPWSHVLHDGTTVAQHIYDTHFAGAERAAELPGLWGELQPLADDGALDEALFTRVAALLDEQARCAAEWRDQLTTYVWRHSGIPDAQGRPLY
ncbi:MAG: hypothetical protein LBM23_03710 [Propionibacteriaceae bacterium]|jgi:alpha-glucuronidase|nr:hypothetical protein [Propionibacteriaceae bacterium]